MDYASKSSPEPGDQNVYLYIPESHFAPQYEHIKPTAYSAIARDVFVEKLAKMTDDDFSRQFQVISVFKAGGTTEWLLLLMSSIKHHVCDIPRQ